MQRAKRIIALAALMIWDVISIVVSALVTPKILYPSNGNWMSGYPEGYILSFVAISSLILIILNITCGNYSSSLRHFGLGEITRVLLSCAIYGVGFYCGAQFLPESVLFQSKFVILMALLLTLMQLGGRSSVRLINEIQAIATTKARIKEGKIRRALIYGAGEAGAYLCSKCRADKNTDIIPVTFIDDNPGLQGRKIHGVKVYGGADKLEEAIKKFDIDEVVVAIPSASKQLLKATMEICRENRCKITSFGSIDDVELSTARVTNINIEELLRRDSVHLNMNVVRKFVENKTVIVTGGAGSIGSEICRQVLKFGCKHLVIFDIHENGLFFIEQELKPIYGDKISMRLGSIRDQARLDEVFTEFSPELVFHAAAHKHVPMMEYSPKEAIKNNVKGTINVAMASIMHKVDKFILISTDKAVNPTNIMGASKRIAEKAIQLLDNMSDTEFSAVRFGNVLGSNGSVVPFFRKQIEAGGPVTVTHPDMRRYFMTIPEAVQLVLEAGAMADGGEIFVLNMGEPVKIYDLACDLIKLSGYEPNVDIEIVFTGLRPGEKLFEEISMKDEDMTKTPNDKIFIMKPIETDESLLAEQIKRLEETVKNENTDEMFEMVKVLVPTFNHNPGAPDKK
ncbi:MAG: polysaccharide biosynthesis protein [Clostridia bacterium]|nr:polysaccharide biosynthesis protein [Clostridia bacterium]